MDEDEKISKAGINMEYAPVNETGADLWLERSNLDGAQLGALAYGVLLTIFIQCIAVLWNPHGNEKRNWALLSYTCLMFTLGSFGNAANMRFNELTFIDARNFPGGPNGFVAAEYNYWVGSAGSICFIIASWFQDGLMLYRVWVIWNHSYKIVAFPTIMFFGSIVMSCFLMFQLTQPGQSLWTTVNFAIPYWSLSIALNILSAGLIAGRLFFVRNAVRAALGANHARQYTSIVAMIIESASLNAITGLIFIISYARKSNVQNLLLPAMGQVQSISPLLIIMRVGQGRAWSKDTMHSGAGSTTKWSRGGKSASSTTTKIAGGNTKPGLKLDSTTSRSESSFHKEVGDSEVV